ncbi:MAG TPA: hypothetical protein EYH07_10455 [Kiloniellaceae bacterium]|nr:hypothetical protein [Kiloniellaceae bacterium]HIP78869.1 hypothetical protein [Kiloniellaceae bacterium]
MFGTAKAGAAAAALALVGFIAAAAVQPAVAFEKGTENRNDDEQRDGHSRNEGLRLNIVPVITDDRTITLRIETVVVIQSRFVHVAETSFGVDYKNLDTVDVGAVPVLGSLFGDRLDAGDFTEENQVGTVYIAGENTLAAVVSDDVNVADYGVGVVNGKGHYRLSGGPMLTEVAPTSLGELGTLPSVQNVLSDMPDPGATLLLGGLKSLDESEQQGVPFLGDIPVLNSLFKGSVHRGRDHELLFFIRPTILTDDDVS